MLKKIFILAGDPSGDIHAARLMRELKIRIPDAKFIGIGGKYMIEEGLNSIIDINKIAVVGLWEVAKKLFFFKNLLKKCEFILKNENIDLFLPVDYPGFNIRLAEHAKKSNIKVVYYIAPQLWAWGKNRTKKLQNNIDLLLNVLPFEEEFFKKSGINSKFVGHPLLDDPKFNKDFLDFSNRQDIISFFPGSRKQEVKKHLPLILETIEELKKHLKNFKYIIAKAEGVDLKHYQSSNFNSDTLLWDNSIELMKVSRYGIIKTGTSNLEAALCGLPFSMFYQTSEISYQLSKRMINLPYISLVNILAGKMIIKEFYQKDANPKNLVEDCLSYMNNQNKFQNIQDEYIRIYDLLGKKGASSNAADEIANFIKQ